MMELNFDLAIVGASIAGSTVALRLKESDARIAIFDKQTFPRRKACGEGLSSKGGELLRSFGIKTRLNPLKGYSVWKNSRCQELGHAADSVGYGVSRRTLDADLLNAAISTNKNVIPFLNTKIRQIEILRDGARLEFESGSITAKRVVIADGAKSLIASRLQISAVMKKQAVHGASLKCEATAELDSVQIVVGEGYEAYLTPLGESEINLSFLGREEVIKKLINSDELKREFERLRELVSIDLTSNCPTIAVGAVAPVRRKSVLGPLILVGDACESLDPVSGVGMSHALITAELAGELLEKFFNKTLTWDQVQSEYLAKQGLISGKLRGYTRAVDLLVRKLKGDQILRISEKMNLPHIFNKSALSPEVNSRSMLLSILGKSFY